MRKDGNRPRRIAELIKRELAALIPRELDDPRAHHVTLTYAEVSPDLGHARVYFTLLAGEAEAGPVAAALNRASGFLRRALADRLRLRVVPELRFEFDRSVERGDRLTRLIDRAISEDRKGHKE
ncbi:ribosome-binding factor A [Sulfurifustis variabilis]|uniref:Ribosome-binding factor A n=1 Tax=Sulfurifustis variabilis TaxID=1675686 RepID=A0A1B4V5Y6_9GAMM|nr:30S ribosome-binding factor RbfA [Sulfurifustis variabilis]BAU48946.1 ribosome-binding factor A [Sulfurifustis variabilis]